MKKQERYSCTNPKMTEFVESFQGSEEFLNGVNEALSRLKDRRLLPCRHQLGDTVEVTFFDSGKITKAKIIKVSFTEGKISYDLEISGKYDPVYKIEDEWFTRLYNVDSVFVDQEKLMK